MQTKNKNIMKKLLSVFTLLSVCAAFAYYVAPAKGEEEESYEVHISEVAPEILEEVANATDCRCYKKTSYIPDAENITPDKYGYLWVDSDGYPICLLCEGPAGPEL